MIRNIFFSFFVAFILFLTYAPFDASMRTCAQQFFMTLMSNEHGTMSLHRCARLSLLDPSATFEKLAVSKDDGWSMKCDQCKVCFSWWKLFTTGVLHVTLELHQLKIKSVIKDNTAVCMAYVTSLLKAKKPFAMPVIIDAVTIQPWNLLLQHEKGTATLHGTMQAKLLRNALKAHCYMHEGAIACAGIQATDCMGSMRFEQHHDGALIMYPDVQMKLGPTGLLTHMTGTWHTDHGRFQIGSLDDSLSIDPIIITNKQKKLMVRAQGHLPLSLASTKHLDLAGKLSLFARAQITDKRAEVYLSTEDALINDHSLHVSTQIKQKKDTVYGLVRASCDNNDIESNWHWQLKKKSGRLDVTNTSPITLFSKWYLEPRAGIIACYAEQNNLTGRCNLHCSSSYQQQNIAGEFSFTDDECSLKFNAGNYTASAMVEYAFPFITSALISHNDRSLLSIKKEEKKLHVQADAHNTLTLINSCLQVPIHADGQVDAYIVPHDYGCNGYLNFEGALRIPHNSNLVRSMHTDFSWVSDKKRCECTHLMMQLYQGTIHMKAGFYDYENRFVYAPLVLDRCVASANKDVCARVSGYAVISQEVTAPLVSGYLMLDKAFVKNLSSVQAPGGVQSSYCLDLHICSTDPIRFDIPRFTGCASLDMHLKRTRDDYQVEGMLKLLQGKVHFPYKDLSLIGGQYLFNGNPINPMVNLHARSMVRKHIVNMYINGPFDQQQVMFDASPPLTEEQIVALLWTGSPEESLNALVPALVTQNIKELMFSNESLAHMFPGMQKFHFNVIPRFSDQTGRGGLRAALEIEVNERWRASLQQNFSLTEDTRFELEYLLSDDITVRAIRDERRDVGAEVEMRFKF